MTLYTYINYCYYYYHHHHYRYYYYHYRYYHYCYYYTIFIIIIIIHDGYTYGSIMGISLTCVTFNASAASSMRQLQARGETRPDCHLRKGTCRESIKKIREHIGKRYKIMINCAIFGQLQVTSACHHICCRCLKTTSTALSLCFLVLVRLPAMSHDSLYKNLLGGLSIPPVNSAGSPSQHPRVQVPKSCIIWLWNK